MGYKQKKMNITVLSMSDIIPPKCWNDGKK